MENCLLLLFGSDGVDGQVHHTTTSKAVLDESMKLYVDSNDAYSSMTSRFAFNDFRKGGASGLAQKHLSCLKFLRDKEAYEDIRAKEALQACITTLESVGMKLPTKTR